MGDSHERERRWLTTRQAAARLGVKPATLYAYVSRGMLHADRSAGGRTSRFDPDEVERLTARGRHAPPAGAGAPAIHSALTTMEGGMLYYRGVAAVDLARALLFEEVAEWLWNGAFPARVAWLDQAAASTTRAVRSALPTNTLPFDRLRLTVAALAGGEGQGDAAPRNARVEGRVLIARLVDTLPLVAATGAPVGRHRDTLPPGAPSHAPREQRVRESMGATGVPGEGEADGTGRTSSESSEHHTSGEPRDARAKAHAAGSHIPAAKIAGSLAARLWPRLAATPPDSAMLDVLNTALVLLADHGLSAATHAARIAASVGGGPHAVIGAGLAVAGGSAHAGTPTAVERLLAEVGEGDNAIDHISERLRRGVALPGFGHPLYPEGDPRAAALLPVIAAAFPGTRSRTVVFTLNTARTRGLPHPNVAFAIGALAHAAAMIPGAVGAIVAIARAAGWIAHAIEEADTGSFIRPPVVYVGPPPVRQSAASGGWATDQA